MSEPFLAEVKMVGFNFSPRGWAYCDGQILPINQNQSLFSLLGTIYGGDGRTSFALPDLRGRTPVHFGSNDEFTVSQGGRSGEENHILTESEMPAHSHAANASGDISGSTDAGNNLLAKSGGGRQPLIPYVGLSTPTALIPASVANAGGGQGHNNMQPYLALNFCIALSGVFPSRN